METTAMLNSLRERFAQTCDRLASGRAYRGWFRTVPSHDGSAHVELEGPFLCYVVTERGSEYERRRTKDEEELFYWLLSDVTSDMAAKYELAHRRPAEDFRRQLFSVQEDLLESLNVTWADRLRKEHESILRTHPFVDGAG